MRLALIFCVLLTGVAAAVAQSPGGAARADLRAVARIDAHDSALSLDKRRTSLRLSLSQPVPWRVFTLDAPPRLVLDFREVDWTGLSAADLLPDTPQAVRFGAYLDGWSRLVLDLPGPLALDQAGMTTGDAGAVVDLKLSRTDADSFAAASGPPPARDGARPDAVAPPDTLLPRRRQDGSRPLVVMLDPGHGGLDPGAERGGVREKDLVLTFARELKARLVRDAGIEVYMTRDGDQFVPLQARVSRARAVGADVFLSLHADALAHGKAEGTTIYTLSETASDRASAILAAREDRSDLISGLDLSAQDDTVAGILMDLARVEVRARSEALAGELVRGITGALGRMHKRPHLRAGFSVLRAPDIPSVLIELGFVSSQSDLARITDPKWRDSLVEGIMVALEAWAIEDAAAAALLRQ